MVYFDFFAQLSSICVYSQGVNLPVVFRCVVPVEESDGLSMPVLMVGSCIALLDRTSKENFVFSLVGSVQ